MICAFVGRGAPAAAAADGVSVSEPIAIGQGPLRLATGERSVWVTSARDGTLTRIDSASGRGLGPRRSISAAASPASRSAPARSGWRARAPARSCASTATAAGSRSEITVGGRPGAVVFGGDRVWVADEDGAGITAINARGGRVFKRGIAPHVAPLRLAVGAGGLWVSSAATGSVRRVDLGTAVAGPPVVVGRGPSGRHRRRRHRLGRQQPLRHASPASTRRPGRCSATRSRSASRPGGIDAGTSVVWVANAADDSVSRIDIESGETIGAPIAVGRHPGAVAVAREAVWVADNGDGAVTRIEP